MPGSALCRFLEQGGCVFDIMFLYVPEQLILCLILIGIPGGWCAQNHLTITQRYTHQEM